MIDTETILLGCGFNSDEAKTEAVKLEFIANYFSIPLKELIIIYSTIKAKGVLAEEETMHFGHLMPLINNKLSEVLNLSLEETKKRIKNKQVSFSDIKITFDKIIERVSNPTS